MNHHGMLRGATALTPCTNPLSQSSYMQPKGTPETSRQNFKQVRELNRCFDLNLVAMLKRMMAEASCLIRYCLYGKHTSTKKTFRKHASLCIRRVEIDFRSFSAPSNAHYHETLLPPPRYIPHGSPGHTASAILLTSFNFFFISS